METEEILKEIRKLSLQKQMYVLEQSLQEIKLQKYKTQMEQAVDLLFDDYKNDKELTSFTNIDFEDFYETR